MSEPDLSDAVAQAKAALERLRAAMGELPDAHRLEALAQAVEPPLRAAGENLVEAVRRRPISALAIAFGAGLALALLTRG
ncbi:MAG: hypothetical protein KGM15_15055 [Pseudomonadota bacterium]|nr:hypothetical protein [Pseudomonadota bacterium]